MLDHPIAISGRYPMDLGAFSVSLTVKDINASRAFYEKLGFQSVGGEQDQGWLILRNGETNIGLFQGMFEKNLLTFNPGWHQDSSEKTDFTDIRDIQRQLKAQGITFDSSADESGEGPASFMITDPDGNMILVDQHV